MDKRKISKLSKLMKTKFFNEGHKHPTCINPGCTKPVVVRLWANWSFKSECSFCMSARKNQRYVIENNQKYILDTNNKKLSITIHKKDYCENCDGHLEFKCPVPRDGWIGFQSSLDLEHIDGDHFNNTATNVETICKICHGRKSIASNDWHSNKLSARKMV